MSTATLPDVETPRHPPAPAGHGGRTGMVGSSAFAALATLIAVLGAAASLHGVISDWGWMLQVSVVVAGIVIAANVVRTISARRYLPTLAGLIAAVALLTLLFFSNTALLGLIPTPSTYRALLEVWAVANDQMGSQVPPVAATGVITFSVCLWAAAVTLAVDTLAFAIRAPAMAGIPLAMLLAIASLFEPRGAGLIEVAITLVGFLLILAAERTQAERAARAHPRALELDPTQSGSSLFSPGRRARGALAQGAIIIAGSLVALLALPVAIPGFSKGMLPEGNRPTWGQIATNIDPLISLGNDLRSRSTGTVLHYFTDSDAPTYLRTSVIGDLTADRWEPDPDAYRMPLTEDLANLTFPNALESAQAVYTRVITDSYRGVWMPLPADAVTLTGLDNTWRWSPETGTLRAAENARPAAADYTVMSVQPIITAEVMRELSTPLPEGYFTDVDQRYVALPEDVPESLSQATSEAVASADDNPYAQAVAIQDYLRSGKFSYSEQTPVQDGYDGSGMDVIDAFLQEKAGYCVHFASTMALMARELGIPSRLVTGYAPGTATGVSITGQGEVELAEYTVNSANAHAWPELYIIGVGWVPFEPTPGRGAPPAYAPAQSGPSATTEADPTVQSSRSSSTQAESSSESSSTAVTAGANSSDPSGPSALPWLIAVAILSLGVIPWLLRRIGRARRITRVRSAGETALRYGKESGAAAAWAELVALGIDHALPMRQDESAGQYARRLGALVPDGAPALDVLATAYERLRYAPSGPRIDPQRLVDALGVIEKALLGSLRLGERVRRLLWPASLFAPRPLEPAAYSSAR